MVARFCVALPGSWFFSGSRRQHEGREAPDPCVRRGRNPHLFRDLGRLRPRQGRRAGRVRASVARSCRRPAEILLAGPQLVEQHRELAGHRDPRLLHADPIGQRAAPGAQRASSLQTGQQHSRRLVQVAAQERVALLGIPPRASDRRAAVELAELGQQTQEGGHGDRRPARWSGTRSTRRRRALQILERRPDHYQRFARPQRLR